MTSCEAIGPPVIDCLKPSIDATSWYAWKFCGTPCQHEQQRADDADRQQHVEQRARHVDPEVADGLAIGTA